ncbi:unnamed protein product [Arctia plantaginis]|uniref:Glucose-methanol-choline oxidoreductase N-terminal domain-containing protein n=1 Tax=Arctia plantaginis TaxID=874455 RepID=A0A8S1AJ78_ARCPL|nr:unnamed protein product [Arctia plantaginis]
MLVASSAFQFLQGLQAALKLLSVLHLTKYEWPQDAVVTDGESFDFIIIGAGTAGSVIANRLTEIKDVNVLLIEAGGDPPLESDIPGLSFLMKRSRYDWNYTAENDAYSDTCHLKPYFEFTLGKMLGGTSSLNYMVYHRGQPQDFNTWAEITKDDRWQWQNVLPYFLKSENLKDPQLLHSPERDFYGTKGYVELVKDRRDSIQPILDAYQELGHKIVQDFNEHHPLGYATQTVTISGKSRHSSAHAFLSSVKNRKNLHVMKNTLVTKIVVEDKKAVGVEVKTKDGKTLHLNAKKEIIVSAGTFNTPKLLMLSGVGPAKHLKEKTIEVISDLPVGENLQEHLGVILIHTLEETPDFGASFTGFVALNKTSNYPDYQVISYLDNSKVLLLYCTFVFRLSDEICDTMFKSEDKKLQAFNQIINIHPDSRGKVLLKTTDPFDAPLVDSGFFSNNNDLENFIDYVQHFSAIMNTTYYKTVNAKMVDAYPKCNVFEAGSREYWRCYVMCVSSGLSHFTGTCPMGKVLDGRLRVHGIKNLRVADASVMPTSTRGNPAASVIMIGEKAADMIKEDYKLI